MVIEKIHSELSAQSAPFFTNEDQELQDRIGCKIKKIDKHDLTTLDIKKIAANVFLAISSISYVISLSSIGISLMFAPVALVMAIAAASFASYRFDFLGKMLDLESERSRAIDSIKNSPINETLKFLEEKHIKLDQVIEYKLFGDSPISVYKSFDTIAQIAKNHIATSKGLNRKTRKQFLETKFQELNNQFTTLIKINEKSMEGINHGY